MDSRNQVEKYSAVPIYLDFEENPTLPFRISDDVSVISLKDQLKPKEFTLWEALASKDAIKPFTQIDLALVHRFYSSEHLGRKEEDSKSLLHKMFVCLRIIRPTRTAFAVVQYRKGEGETIHVQGFSVPPDPVILNLPESEVLNRLRVSDLALLGKIGPGFVTISENGPDNLRRAIRYYETGYSEIREADLQFTVWMMGIEALFSGGQDESEPETIKGRIIETIGAETDIYHEFEDRYLYATNPIRVKDVLDEMFRLRNRLIHGAWVPEDWFKRKMRNSISGEALTVADILREAASFILRRGIRRTLLLSV
jgi:hypothetical protein